MDKQFLRFLQFTLFSLDILILNLVIITCKLLLGFFNEHIPILKNLYVEYWILINSFWLIFAWLGGVYAEKSILSFELYSARTIKAYIIWFTFLILYLFFTKSTVSRLFIGSTIIFFGIGLFIGRF